MFGVFFVAGGFGATINAVLRTRWGHLFNIQRASRFHLGAALPKVNHITNAAVFFRVIGGRTSLGAIGLIAVLASSAFTCWPARFMARWCDD